MRINAPVIMMRVRIAKPYCSIRNERPFGPGKGGMPAHPKIAYWPMICWILPWESSTQFR